MSRRAEPVANPAVRRAQASPLIRIPVGPGPAVEAAPATRDAPPAPGPVDATCEVPAVDYTVSVRHLCEFAAKSGDLDLRFTPSPTAQQGREGHLLVAQRRGADYETEISLSGTYERLAVRGRADGFDGAQGQLEEIKTFRGSADAIAANQQALHWAQLKVYGALLCRSRSFERLRLCLVYWDIVAQTEHPVQQDYTAGELQAFFETLCGRFLGWAQREQLHRQRRDAALAQLVFPQPAFRPGQYDMAAAVYRSCVQSRTLLVQAPTGIGKSIGSLYPALRAMPQRGLDRLLFLTAKTPGRQVALDALHQLRAGMAQAPLRVIELVARDKACEHKDKACHGDACPLARGFYDRLPAARQAAADQAWLDRAAMRDVALAHGVCPYYLGQEMARWSDVVVGDYNYYFDRSAMLHAMAVDAAWRFAVLVDEAHNLVPRAGSMYSAELSPAELRAARTSCPPGLRALIDAWLDQWQLLHAALRRESPADNWQQCDEIPAAWLRLLTRFNSGAGEFLQSRGAQVPDTLLALYFRTLDFAALAESFGEHSLCELEWPATDAPTSDSGGGGCIRLRNVVPAPFLSPRIRLADAMVLLSATLNPADYYQHLLGMPEGTVRLDVASPFHARQLSVRVAALSTRRESRHQTLDRLVQVIARQFDAQPGNYLAFFSSFDYMEMAFQRLAELHPAIPVWAQQRQMDEAARQAYLQRFDPAGRGIGFAVLGGVFGEGVDLPGRRLDGAFVATLGLPQFDHVNAAICRRLDLLFGQGYAYTYLFPGLQKVVQAAGRVIRSPDDTGVVVLLDTRYREQRYRQLLPAWWGVGADANRDRPQACLVPVQAPTNPAAS